VAFIQLDRRFRQVSAHGNAEDAAWESYAASVEGKDAGLGWNDVLTHRLVVLLGEPGSGKTWELEAKVEQLNRQGQTAFYLRLEDLVNNPLEQVISADQLERLSQWKEGQSKAVFFLDSVDEAKLRVETDFGRALRRFQATVGMRALVRASIFISSRITEWRPRSDEKEVLAILGLPPLKKASRRTDVVDESGANGQVFVIQIEPLDRARVQRMVSELGVADAPRFTEALDASHAWPFARRPLDVASLASYWLQHGQLGTLSTLIEHDVTEKLAETEQRRQQDPLTPELARLGAETLAASALFCRKLTFRVPEQGQVDDGAALDASACLPGVWMPAQVRALMARAIFDGASYGRIRFHHRQILEYLAASWLSRRMREGCGTRELKDLLIDTTRLPARVRPNSAPVLAWLANGAEHWNDFAREWITRLAPWVPMRYGDPAGLSVAYKRELLRAIGTRFRDHRRVWLDYDNEALARLSHAELAPDVDAMVRDRALPEDLRVDMLALVRHGRLAACLDAAIDIIGAVDEPRTLKLYAATALRDVANHETLRRLHAVVRPLVNLDSALCGYLCEALYPRVISGPELCALVEKVAHVPDRATDLPWMLKAHLETSVPDGDLEPLVRALITLGRRAPHVTKGNEVIPLSQQFSWLREVLQVLLGRLVALAENAEIQTCIDGLDLLADAQKVEFEEREGARDLSESSFERPAVRRAHFWTLRERWRGGGHEEPNYQYQVYEYTSILKPDRRDVTWLVPDIVARPDSRDRELALRCAWDYLGAFDVRGQIQLARYALRASNTRSLYLKLLVNALPLSARRFWLRRRHTYGGAWWWRMRLHKIARWWVWLRDQWHLHLGIWKLLSGKQQGWLAHLAREAATSDTTRPHWGTTDWSAVRKRRGPLIAWAAELGCIRAWRNFRPLLPHEKPDPSQTSLRVVMGLAGLNSAVARGRLDLASLSDADARLAARYSVNELNGFAPWMEALARVKPAAVTEELRTAIAGEWQFPADRQHVHEVISDLLWHGEESTQLVVPSLLDLLRAGDPAHHTILSHTLSILLKRAQASYDELGQIARARLAGYGEGDPAFMTWLAVWMQLNANDALPALEARLGASPNPRELMERLCNELRGDRLERTPRAAIASYTTPACLRRFLPLVFRFVAPAQDINRAGGGVYTPTARDHAQDFRDGLLRVVANSDHDGVDNVLKDLAEEAAMAPSRDWILHLADERQARESDGPAWQPADIRSFIHDYERDPINERELFAIAVRRLSDIKEEVEDSDNSPRGELNVDHLEGDLRFWLARKLLAASRDRYTVPQEEQVDQGHPDLRFHRPGIGPVSVEIKWANRGWTAEQLLERLENQLVGQYMRDPNARFGVYVVGRIGTQRHWVHGGVRLTFDDLITLLTKRAEDLMRERPQIRGLRVISIDFVSPRDRG
jgi:hypothetical protein